MREAALRRGYRFDPARIASNLWGAGHVVSIEDELMVDNFSLKAGDALLGKTVDSIIAQNGSGRLLHSTRSIRPDFGETMRNLSLRKLLEAGCDPV